MAKGHSIVNAAARLQKHKWLTRPIVKALRITAGMVLAGLIAVSLTLLTQPTAYAKGLNAHILPDGSVAPPPQAQSACQQDLATCFININSNFQLDNPQSNPNCVQFHMVNLPGKDCQVGQIQNPLAQGNTLFFFTPAEVTAGNDQIKALWQVVMDIVDAFIVIILMLSGLKIILGGTVFQYANAVETVPGMLVALIAAHLSMLIVAFFLGLNNALSVDLYYFASSRMVSPTLSGTNLDVGFGQTICTTINGLTFLIPACNPASDIAKNVNITPTNLGLPSIWDALGTIGGIAGLVLKILGLMMLGQIIIRIFFINLYIIIAPMGLACWALPGKAGQGLTRMWLQGFISTVLVQFLQVVALIVTQLMIGIVAKHLTNLPGLDPATLLQILEISIIWFILRIPSLLNTAPMRTISEAGQAMGQVAGASLAVSATEVQGVMSLAGGAASLGVAAAL